MSDNPLVSVVVPTYNSEEHLSACLESVARQSYESTELIVVDNHSTDRTREIARQFTGRVYVKGDERSAQVNFGFQVANGEYLYRVDSDVVLEPTIVEQAVEQCENGIDAVYVHNTSDPSVSFWSKVRKFERDFYKGDDLNVAVRFFRRDVIEAVGGFDEELIAGEDYDLHNRIVERGYEVETVDSEELHLGEPETLCAVLEQHYFYGQTLTTFLEKNPNRGTRQMSFVRPAYFRQWRRFVRNPRLTAGFLVYQLLRYVVAGLGLLSASVSTTHGASTDNSAPHPARNVRQSNEPEVESARGHLSDEPLVSIVVPTYNEAERVNWCLTSIESQTYDRIELVVVDAFSDDGTAEMVGRHGCTLIQSDDAMSEARNTGIEHASGEFLLSIDADMELEATVVERCVEAYEAHDRVGGIIIPERSVGGSYWVKVRDFERSFYDGTVVESARFFPMDVVRRVGGYDEDLTFFEDSTLPQRIERETGLMTNLRIDGVSIRHHEESFQLLDWLRKKYRYGKSVPIYRSRYNERAAKQIHPIYRLTLFTAEFERFCEKPTLLIGVLLLKGLEFGSVGLGVLFGKVSE